MENEFYYMFPGMELEEKALIDSVTKGFTEDEQRQFVMLYQARRQDPQNVMLFTLLGFLGFAGVQRFILGDIVLGILYFITCGFCFIGTIIDLVNYKSMTLNHNKIKVIEASNLIKMHKR